MNVYGPTSSKRPRLDNGNASLGGAPPPVHRSYQPADRLGGHNNQVIPPPPHPPSLAGRAQPPSAQAPPHTSGPHGHSSGRPYERAGPAHQRNPPPNERGDRPRAPPQAHARPESHLKHLATVVDNGTANSYAENFAKMLLARMNNRYVGQFKYPYIHDVTSYTKITKIGQGTFGEVFQARCNKSKRFVALKKILMENEREGFPITAIREVKMLQRLKHEHITDLIEICNTKGEGNSARDKSNFYLVFTYCDYDLAGFLSHSAVKLTLEDVKILMKHLLMGLYKIHQTNILHRDMKAANVLVTNDGVLRLADFGLSRPILKSSSKQNYTNRVVTLWYRPPELLLGSRHYGPQIDIWGAGCIMAELWTRTPILQGETEQKQLELIQRTCGGINTTVWPTVETLPLYGRMELMGHLPRVLRDNMKRYTQDEHALNLLDSLLTLDPASRLDAERALEHDFFFYEPRPKTNNIKHIVSTLPKNIFEFTAGRGAHANRHPKHAAANGVANRQRHGARPHNPQDSQLQDMIF